MRAGHSPDTWDLQLVSLSTNWVPWAMTVHPHPQPGLNI